MLPSQPPPSTVDSVKPSDVAVLSAIGLDMHSTGLSKVVGRLHEMMTLFNPALVLYQPSLQSPHFAQHRNLLEQAEDVSYSLRSNQANGDDRDWKLVLLVIQVDQLCACEEQQVRSSIRATVEQVDAALQLLHSQLKRTIVSVALWDGEYTHQNRKCPCMETKSEEELRLLRVVLTEVLQESLDELLENRGWFGDREDFTVLLQDTPLMRDPASFAHGRVPTESQASRYTDELTVRMWANLLQPQSVHQQSTEDNGMIISVPCPSEDRPFLRTEGNSPSYGHRQASPLLHPITGTEMPCEDLGPSPSPPTTVHTLRPGDIKVVGAIGDSLTAGNGVGSKNQNNILDVLRQYRGLSWSIGGDENLTTVTTLPNILRHFNPLLTGYSVGMGREDTPQAFLNQAVAGDKSKDMPTQARALIARMKNDSRINFESDWKLITLFIGGNDICDHCYNSQSYSPQASMEHIRDALDILHKEVPRTLVNLVEVLHIIPLREMHIGPSVNCPTWLVKILCPCVISPQPGSPALKKVEQILKDYQRVVNELVESGRYDTKTDFTVVVQPFFREVTVPKLPDGRPDRSYFSPDCFHLSQKAQTLMARSLWNNMLEPLGHKVFKQDFNATIELKCPSKSAPYVRTYYNSNYTYADPSPPPPGPIPNWGSDFSCVDIAPSATVPTSVHKLRPADIKVVAALGDSSTVGTGAKAANLLEVNRKYKGVSFSIGGDLTLENVTTLPNILRKFNPNLLGFSKGLQKDFNMAVPGAKTSDIPAQVEALIKAMKANKKVDFEKDWKLVTVFVGANDLCSYCLDQNNLSPKNFSHNLKVSLDILYKEVPRVLVNLVEFLQMDPVRTIKRNTLGCGLIPRTTCGCVINPDDNSPEFEEIKRINLEYQTETEYLVSGDHYDGREDFTVVLQPYLRNSFVPYTEEGKIDNSLFSVDCLHPSERGHAEMALALWNNMLEPVGKKQTFNNFTYDRSKIHCPSEAQPFIFTKVNSMPSPPVTTTTAAPVTDTTTTTSSRPDPVPTSPVTQCEEPLVWVPVVVSAGSILVGMAAAWLFFSCRQRKKEEKAIELKASGF